MSGSASCLKGQSIASGFKKAIKRQLSAYLEKIVSSLPSMMVRRSSFTSENMAIFSLTSNSKLAREPSFLG